MSKQKFPTGSRVRIQDDLDTSTTGRDATVLYTYGSRYGGRGSDFKKYSLDIDGVGHESWYNEQQLTSIES